MPRSCERGHESEDFPSRRTQEIKRFKLATKDHQVGRRDVTTQVKPAAHTSRYGRVYMAPRGTQSTHLPP